ncbi:MAG: glycosyltransferase, partial [Ardenticatenaceae bacterium]
MDPHPRAVLEAMAASLPILAFDVDGVSETVIDDETGYLISHGDVHGLLDAARNLALNKAWRASMGDAGRRRVETCFSAQATAEQVAEIIGQQLDRVKGMVRTAS